MSRAEAVKWGHEVRSAGYAKEIAGGYSWLKSPRHKMRWTRRARERREAADRLRSAMETDPIGTLARALVENEWQHLAQYFSNANPNHPRLDALREMLAPRVAAAARGLPAAHRRDLKFNAAEVPGLSARLTAEYALAVMSERSEALAKIAADPVMLARPGVKAKAPALTIQHKASGLRARFVLEDSSPGYGTVFSKPYEINSIDPANPGHCSDWETYVGLGIGTQIYLEGERLNPGIRWRTQATRDGSRGVRRKLHASNPHTWQDADCTWCNNMTISWDTATAADYERHPRDPQAAAIPPPDPSPRAFPLEGERRCRDWRDDFDRGATVIGARPGGGQVMLWPGRDQIIIGDGGPATSDFINLLAYGTLASPENVEMTLVAPIDPALPSSENLTTVITDDLSPAQHRALLMRVHEEIQQRQALADENGDKKRFEDREDLGISESRRMFVVIEDAPRYLAVASDGDPAAAEETAGLVREICESGHLHDVDLILVVPRANPDIWEVDKYMGLANRVGIARLDDDTIPLLFGETEWCPVNMVAAVPPMPSHDSPRAAQSLTARLSIPATDSS